MKIKNLEKIFKLEINHELNKPMMFKVWANSKIDKLELDNQTSGNKELTYIKQSVVDKRFISHFSLNKEYKNQLRKEIQDFITVGLNFVPDYIVYDDRVELVTQKLGQKYDFDEKNITKIEYKSSNYQKLNLSFNAVWQHLYANFYSNSGKITSYNFEQLKKNMPLCSDYKSLRVLNSNLYLSDNIFTSDNKNLYKFSICNYSLQFLYYVNILRNELIMFSSQISDTNSSATKNIEYTIKIPYRPGIKDWQPNQSYRLLDIVSFSNKTYEATKDNNKSKFDASDWKEIKLKKHLSFNNAFSFFSTEYGNNIFEKIKSAIPMQVEKNISDTIVLCLVNSATPKLNDYFSYQNKKFRIISLSIHQGTHEFVEIVGQEILNSKIKLDNDYFADGAEDDYFADGGADYFSQLNWEHDGKIGMPEICIHNASTKEFSQEQFEGIEIRIPAEASITSRCDVNIKFDVATKDRSEI